MNSSYMGSNADQWNFTLSKWSSSTYGSCCFIFRKVNYHYHLVASQPKSVISLEAFVVWSKLLDMMLIFHRCWSIPRSPKSTVKRQRSSNKSTNDLYFLPKLKNDLWIILSCMYLIEWSTLKVGPLFPSLIVCWLYRGPTTLDQLSCTFSCLYGMRLAFGDYFKLIN